MKKYKEYKKFALSGNAKDALVATQSKNCDLTGGVLRTGIRLKNYVNVNGFTVSLPNGATEAEELFYLHIRESGKMMRYLAVFLTDGEIYYYDPVLNDGLGAWIADRNFGTKMRSIVAQEETGTLRTYLCGATGIFYYATTLINTSISKATPVGCFHYGRVFAHEGNNKILYSIPYNFASYKDSYEQGGCVYVPTGSGTICDLVPFQEKIYVFCERGIFAFDAVGSAKDFVLKPIAYTGGLIFGDSARVVTGGIYFLTEQGVCFFDGQTVRSVGQNINVAPKADGQRCASSVYDGKYQVRFLDTSGTPTSVVIDCQTGEGYFSFVPNALSCLDKQGLCVQNGKIKRLQRGGESPEPSQFIARTDFGERKRKTLQSLCVNGTGLLRIRVFNGMTGKILSCMLTGMETKLDVLLRGNEFDIMLELGPDTCVHYLRAEYETLG
ncbi:MAG: hypothetical protein IJ996_05760 [Clostridia bacterium]|nr:hypothetical protein [Clostridia bacterium]